MIVLLVGVMMLALITVSDHQVAHDQHHGVPGEDVVPTEGLFIPQRDAPSCCDLQHLIKHLCRIRSETPA